MKPVVMLIRTSPPHGHGSMSRFGHMIQAAMAVRTDLVIDTCDLAPVNSRSIWYGHFWRAIHAKRILRECHADLFHLLDGSMAACIPNHLHSRTVVTVHDVIPSLQCEGKLPGKPSIPAAWFIQRSLRSIAGMEGVHTESACSLQDLQSRIPHPRCKVIPLAIPSFQSASQSMRGLPARFILHVGNNAFYKNRTGVLDIFARLADLTDVHLVMAGSEPDGSLRAMSRKIERLHFMVDVDDGTLAGLYRKASLLLFPSLYEGFGMPVLEAMSNGCPVVCSAGGALPEVAGGAALIAPVDAVQPLADHCRAILTDSRLRETLVAKGKRHADGFTMHRFADSLAAWYGEILNLGEKAEMLKR